MSFILGQKELFSAPWFLVVVKLRLVRDVNCKINNNVIPMLTEKGDNLIFKINDKEHE